MLTFDSVISIENIDNETCGNIMIASLPKFSPLTLCSFRSCLRLSSPLNTGTTCVVINLFSSIILLIFMVPMPSQSVDINDKQSVSRSSQKTLTIPIPMDSLHQENINYRQRIEMKRTKINWIETQAMIVDSSDQHIIDQHPPASTGPTVSTIPATVAAAAATVAANKDELIKISEDDHRWKVHHTDDDHERRRTKNDNNNNNNILSAIPHRNSTFSHTVTPVISSNDDRLNSGKSNNSNTNNIKKLISVSKKIFSSRITRQIHSKSFPLPSISTSKSSMQTYTHKDASKLLSFSSSSLSSHGSSGSSGSSGPSSSTTSLISQQIQPNFDHHRIKRNFTVPLGGTGYLQCRINNLADKTVSWVRQRDLQILTWGRDTYVGDSRFRSLNYLNSNEWTLEIRDAKMDDTGVYQCQISSSPKLSTSVFLRVIELRTIILGGPEIYLQKNTDINLTCIINYTPDSSSNYMVIWEHNGNIINFNRGRGVRVINKEIRTPYNLFLTTTTTTNTTTSTTPTSTTNPISPHVDSSNKSSSPASGLHRRKQYFQPHIPEMSLSSSLLIGTSNYGDTGNYSCRLSSSSLPSLYAKPASVRVNIMNGGENPAAMQGGARSGFFMKNMAQNNCFAWMLSQFIRIQIIVPLVVCLLRLEMM
ncbi:uncharacterized protein LOC141852522 [Brevipalpus obovatus]|uniref:uncharacterized protein LOC141852522 n=1 Tax=Brevipalpus obovatus TaxID=246614 RepID=UPI003D9E0D45